jgi:hypothetical protein
MAFAEMPCPIHPIASAVPDRHRQRLSPQDPQRLGRCDPTDAVRREDTLEAAFTTALGTPSEGIDVRWGRAAAIQARPMRLTRHGASAVHRRSGSGAL